VTQITANLVAGFLMGFLSHTWLYTIYVFFALGGCILSLFLRPVKDPNLEKQDTRSSLRASLLATLKLLFFSPVLMLLVPMILYNGLEMGFIWGDFTKYYAVPALGQDNMPFVMCAFGATDALASLLFGRLSDVIGRPIIVAVGALCQLSILICSLVLTIEPLGDDKEPEMKSWIMLFVGAAVWGIGDAVWNTQIMAILGEWFRCDKSAAFANYKLWQSLATAVAFAYNDAFESPKPKVYILLGTLAVGLIGYGIAISMHQRKSRQIKRLSKAGSSSLPSSDMLESSALPSSDMLLGSEPELYRDS